MTCVRLGCRLVFPKIPGVSHRRAGALRKAGFRVVREGKHIVATDGQRILTIPRAVQSTPLRWVELSKTQGSPLEVSQAAVDELPHNKRLELTENLPQLSRQAVQPTADGGRGADENERERACSTWDGGKLMSGRLNRVRVWIRFSAACGSRTRDSACAVNARRQVESTSLQADVRQRTPLANICT